MSKWLVCGKYTCLVSGSNNLFKQISDHWFKDNSIPICSMKEIKLHIEEGTEETYSECADGWKLLDDQDTLMVAYIHNGKVRFILQYTDHLYDVRVIVRKALDRYVMIGMHYGLMLALHRECVGLHGVTILCGNEVVILSAPSGTGKTTLGKLLEKYCEGIIINGDFALLSPTEDGVIYEPTPFCGTSGRSLNHRFRVNRVVFLGQAKQNEWRKLSGREAIQQFMSNSFIPTWDSHMQSTVEKNILKVISMLKINAYSFIPTQMAAKSFMNNLSIN